MILPTARFSFATPESAGKVTNSRAVFAFGEHEDLTSRLDIWENFDMRCGLEPRSPSCTRAHLAFLFFMKLIELNGEACEVVHLETINGQETFSSGSAKTHVHAIQMMTSQPCRSAHTWRARPATPSRTCFAYTGLDPPNDRSDAIPSFPPRRRARTWLHVARPAQFGLTCFDWAGLLWTFHSMEVTL